jgi:hypothetical protein
MQVPLPVLIGLLSNVLKKRIEFLIAHSAFGDLFAKGRQNVIDSRAFYCLREQPRGIGGHGLSAPGGLFLKPCCYVLWNRNRHVHVNTCRKLEYHETRADHQILLMPDCMPQITLVAAFKSATGRRILFALTSHRPECRWAAFSKDGFYGRETSHRRGLLRTIAYRGEPGTFRMRIIHHRRRFGSATTGRDNSRGWRGGSSG